MGTPGSEGGGGWDAESWVLEESWRSFQRPSSTLLNQTDLQLSHWGKELQLPAALRAISLLIRSLPAPEPMGVVVLSISLVPQLDDECTGERSCRRRVDKAGDPASEPLVPSSSQTYLPFSLQTHTHALSCTPTLLPSTHSHSLLEMRIYNVPW